MDEQAVERMLLARGLYAHLRADGRALIGRLFDSSVVNSSLATVAGQRVAAIRAEEVESGIIVDPSLLWRDGVTWVFENIGVGYFGGFDVNEFEMRYSEQQTALEALLAFYFGSPTGIGVWDVPLHRHPGWNESDVRSLVAQAASISAQEFRELRPRDEATATWREGQDRGRQVDRLRDRYFWYTVATTDDNELRFRCDLKRSLIVRGVSRRRQRKM